MRKRTHQRRQRLYARWMVEKETLPTRTGIEGISVGDEGI